MDGSVQGRVGPNAILQSREALKGLGGPAMAQAVFDAAGLADMLDCPDDRMVPEAVAARLHRAIAAHFPRDEALRVARDAGRRTGAYILTHRIPRPARWVLRRLPARASGPILLRAIHRHAWTFAGSAGVAHDAGPPMRFEIRRNPLAVPGCPWHCAVFETLFRRLVDRDLAVVHESCCAEGADACRFRIAPPGR